MEIKFKITFIRNAKAQTGIKNLILPFIKKYHWKSPVRKKKGRESDKILNGKIACAKLLLRIVKSGANAKIKTVKRIDTNEKRKMYFLKSFKNSFVSFCFERSRG